MNAMRAPCVRRGTRWLVLLLLGCLLAVGSLSYVQAAPGGKRLETGQQFSVQYPDTWSLAPDQFANSYSLIDVPADQQGRKAATARVKILAEQRLNHGDALKQLREIAAGLGVAPGDFVRIGGWPALQTQRLETRPQPSQGPQYKDEQVLRINSWIAAGDQLIYVHASLPSDADADLIQTVKAIAASLQTDHAANSEQTSDELEQLQHGQASAVKMSAQVGGRATHAQTMSMGEAPPQEGAQTPPSTFNQRIIFNGFGELEIAASNDGQTIVVGRQSAWVTSNDGGATFPTSGSIPSFDGGDPSLAVGASGAIYYAGIDRNCHNSGYLNPPPMLGFGQDCTGFTRSTDNGATFPIGGINPAVACPRDDPNNPGAVVNTCFPDQEHIAADRINTAAGGGDQVYSTWRNFDAADQDGGLVCTQDNGVNWTAPFDLGPGSFFPRITVGGNGFVYVIAYDGGNYRLWKFSSCTNGLALQPGFPVNVFARTPIDCPFAGHDRCDQNPSSQTVVVDDGNPNHVYFAVAQSDATPNRDATIWIRDSLDGGMTWTRPAVRANVNIPAPRIFPWLCATGGDAYVTWFDRRSATPCPGGNCPGINNDSTDIYAARVGLDDGGNLVGKGEFKVSEVAHNWCGPPNTAWPAPTRQALQPPPGASEACSLQPQLGGQCCVDLVDGMGNPGADGACDAGTATGTPCDVSDDNPGTRCGVGQVCLGGGGVPRYGDYNGNTCIAGRLFMAWPSSTSPPGVPAPNPGAEGILFDAFLVGAVPFASIPGDLDFGAACTTETDTATLNVCNTGNENLLVTSIVSSNPQFDVTTPSSGYPVQISPDFCFPFQATFTPTSAGDQSATLTVATNDPANASVDVAVTGAAEAPQVTVSIEGGGAFGNVAVGDAKVLNANVLNESSVCPGVIDNVTRIAQNPASDDFTFAGLPTGLSFPVTLQPGSDFSLPFRFAPEIFVPQTATFRIATNDDDIDFDVSGASPPPNIDTSGNLAFGPVCAGVNAERTVQICNTGTLNTLEVTSAQLVGPGCADFTLVGAPNFPLDISHDFCVPLSVRYTPTGVGDHNACNLVITSNDPDTPVVSLPLSGSTPEGNIAVDGDKAFPPTVIQSIGPGKSSQPFTITNVGQCPATVTSVAITENAAEYSLEALPAAFPVTIAPGEKVSDGQLTLAFEPVNLQRIIEGEVTVGYYSDPIVPTEQLVSRDLCGEGVRTGARVLVTVGGVPADSIDQIQLHRINANRNGKKGGLVDSIDNIRNAALMTEPGNGVCPGFQYHREYGTVSNPVQLLPGSYLVSVSTKVGGKPVKKNVSFEVGTTDFVATIVVDL